LLVTLGVRACNAHDQIKAPIFFDHISIKLTRGIPGAVHANRRLSSGRAAPIAIVLVNAIKAENRTS
jgi:hypothetical protein